MSRPCGCLAGRICHSLSLSATVIWLRAPALCGLLPSLRAPFSVPVALTRRFGVVLQAPKQALQSRDIAKPEMVIPMIFRPIFEFES